MAPSKEGFMQAVQYEGNGVVGTNIVPKPKLLEPEDALVRITSSAICGTDLHIYHGLMGDNDVPHGLGHEAVGIVEEIGGAVDFFKPGDRVVVLCFAEDGHLLPKPRMIRWEPGAGVAGYGMGATFDAHDGLQSKCTAPPGNEAY